jgi:hypothetical protein
VPRHPPNALIALDNHEVAIKPLRHHAQKQDISQAKKKQFFFEKKNQKTFVRLEARQRYATQPN